MPRETGYGPLCCQVDHRCQNSGSLIATAVLYKRRALSLHGCLQGLDSCEDCQFTRVLNCSRVQCWHETRRHSKPLRGSGIASSSNLATDLSRKGCHGSNLQNCATDGTRRRTKGELEKRRQRARKHESRRWEPEEEGTWRAEYGPNRSAGEHRGPQQAEPDSAEACDDPPRRKRRPPTLPISPPRSGSRRHRRPHHQVAEGRRRRLQ